MGTITRMHAEQEPADERLFSSTTIAVTFTYEGLPITIQAPLTDLRRQLPKLAALVKDVGGTAPAAPTSAAEKPARKTVAPFYDGNGDACCPIHKKALQEGQYGLYCSAKATGDQVADKKGYCGLRFKD